MIRNEIDSSFNILRTIYCNINPATFSRLYNLREKEFMKLWNKNENIILFLRDLKEDDKQIFINWIETGHNITIKNLKKACCIAEIIYEKIRINTIINDEQILNKWKTINNIPKFISIISHNYLDLIKKWAYDNILIEDIYDKYTTIDNHIPIFQMKQELVISSSNVLLVKPTINITDNSNGFSSKKNQKKNDNKFIKVRDLNQLNTILNH